jgi:hypothetical protein
VLETWSYRWASEILHEVAKQVTGLEAAQVRKEEAVKRHFRLSRNLECSLGGRCGRHAEKARLNPTNFGLSQCIRSSSGTWHQSCFVP